MTSIFAPRRPGQIRFDVFLVAFEGDHVAFNFGHTASSMVTLLHLWSHCFIYGHTASSMQQISMALASVRLGCLRNLDLVLSLVIMHTTRWSLIKLSVWSLNNSQVLALLRRSVIYWSIVSLLC